MRFVRRVLLGLSVPILVCFLFGIAFSTGIAHTFSNPAPIKHIISDSGIYNSVLNSSLDQASPIIGGGVQIPFSDITLRKAATSTFPPQFIRQNTETVIDSIYKWLDDKTPLPDFYIDLSAQKIAFATSVAQSVQQQLASLPTCTRASIPQNFDALNTTCLPTGITPSTAAASLRSDILGGQGFLDNPIITADTIKADGSKQSIFADQLKDAPQYYRNIKAAPSVLAALSVLVTIAVVFLSRTRRSGVKKIGFILLISGIFLLLMAWSASHITTDRIAPKISFDANVVQSNVRAIFVDVVKSISKSWWYFGALYCALGLLTIIATIFGPKQSTNQPGQETPAKQSEEADNNQVTAKRVVSRARPAPKKSRKVIVQ
jgi:hypothetical protein